MGSFLRLRESFGEEFSLSSDDVAQEDGGDIESAIARLVEQADTASFLNTRLPLFPNMHELAMEIWMSTPKERQELFLQHWGNERAFQ